MKIHSLKRNAQGFTLIELLVVIGILAILLAITLIALNPSQHFAGARNSQRSSDVTAILDGIYEYQAANTGNLPSDIVALTAGNTYSVKLSSPAVPATEINLCSDLVPSYLADLPKDPDTNVSSQNPSTGQTCSATTYNTGYTLAKSASGRITVSAPGAENSANISVTR